MKALDRDCGTVLDGAGEAELMVNDSRPIDDVRGWSRAKLSRFAALGSFILGSFVGISEANADQQTPVEVTYTEADNGTGNVHEVNGKKYFVPFGEGELHSFPEVEVDPETGTDFLCARTFIGPVVGTYCKNGGLVQINGVSIGSIHPLGNGYTLYSYGKDFEITDNYDVEGTYSDIRLVPNINSFAGGFEFVDLPGVFGNVVEIAGDVEFGPSLVIYSVNGNGGDLINYTYSNNLNIGDYDPLGYNVTMIGDPFVTGRTVRIIGRDSITRNLLVLEMEVNGWFENAGNTEIISKRSIDLGNSFDKVLDVSDSEFGFAVFGLKDNELLAIDFTSENEIVDTDGDGIEDPDDNCLTISNTDQADTDSDGIGDACDNCPDDANADQNPNVCEIVDNDLDNDGIENPVDNCPATSNPDQADLDEDSLGDVCDDDIDGDGVLNVQDQCPRTPDDSIGIGAGPAGNGCPAEQIEDQDEDGIADADDNCPAVVNADQVDQDRDGIGDACDDSPCGSGMTVEKSGDIVNCVVIEEDAGNDIVEDTGDVGTNTDTGTISDTNVGEETDVVKGDTPEDEEDTPKKEPKEVIPPKANDPGGCSITPGGKEGGKTPTGLFLGLLTAAALFRRKRK